MPALSPELKVTISVFASFAGIVFAVFSAFLAADFKYWIAKHWTKTSSKKRGAKPKKKSWVVWTVYAISGTVMTIGPAIVAISPSKIPLNYFVVVDSSSRMSAVFPSGYSGLPAGASKWDALQNSIQPLLRFTADSDKYRLIALGGNLPESTLTCNQRENKILINNREKIIETINILRPGGVASLDDALMMIRGILSDIPVEQNTVLYLFLGGGDECAKNEGKDEWKDLNYFLLGAESLFDKLYVEIILLPNEGKTIDGVNELYNTIDKFGLTNVKVYSPENFIELTDLIKSLGNNTQPTTSATGPLTSALKETSTVLPILSTPTISPIQTNAQTSKNPWTQTNTPSLTFIWTPTKVSSLAFTPTQTDTPAPTSTQTPTNTPTLPPNCTPWAWEFNTNDVSDGWQIGQGITLEVQNTSLMGKVMEPQGYWTGPDNLDIDANAYKILEIRYRIQSTESPDTAYIYWITADDPQFENGKRARFDENVQTDYTWQVKTVDLSQLSLNWNGTITGIRLYPAWSSNADALVEYDYIRLCQ